MEYLADVREMHLNAMFIFICFDIHVTELSSGFQLNDGCELSDGFRMKSHLAPTIKIQR